MQLLAPRPTRHPAATLDEIKARHRAVQMLLSEHRGGVVLSSIRVGPHLRRRGLADAAVADLTRWADARSVVLALNPEGMGTGASNTALRRWFGRHGFVQNKGAGRNRDFHERMVREPWTRQRRLATERDDDALIAL